MSKTFL